MKKVICIILITLITIVFAVPAFAATPYNVNGVKYLLRNINGSTAEIEISNITVSGEITVPEKINGYTIVGVANEGFKNCRKVTKVNLPSTVTKIGNNAFEKCISLTSVNLENINEKGSYIFSDCYSLKSVTIPWNDVPVAMFYNCYNLQNVKLQNASTLNNMCFMNCKSLASIDVSKVYNYGTSVFKGCTALKQIELFNTNKIANNTFTDCTNLSTVIIPECVKTIGKEAFKGCKNLGKIVLDKNIQTISDNAFENCENITYIKIQNTIQTIGKEVFKGCNNLPQILMMSKNEDGISLGSNWNGTATVVWNRNATEESIIETNKVTYKYNKKEYKVTYDANGGTTNAKSYKCAYQSVVNTTYTASADAKYFMGWSTNKNATVPDAIIIMPAHDLTVYAIYSTFPLSEREITLTYDSDGGDFTPAPQKEKVKYNTTYGYEKGASFVLASYPTKSGYTCTGWMINGTLYEKGENIILTKDATAKAVWQANYYSVVVEDRLKEKEINSNEWTRLGETNISRPFGSTVRGREIGSDTTAGAYYTSEYTFATGRKKMNNLIYVSDTSTVVTTGDNKVYRNFQRQFDIDATIYRKNDKTSNTFKKGQRGVLEVALFGYVDRITIEFEAPFNTKYVTLNVDEKLTPEAIRTYTYEFDIPFNEELKDGNYKVKVTGYKGNEKLTVYPDLNIDGSMASLTKLRTVSRYLPVTNWGDLFRTLTKTNK